MDRSSFSRREYITQALRGLGIAFASGASPASAPEDTNSRVPLENGDLRLVPASHARPPAPYVPAILFVIRAELLAQRRLFVEENKQMHAESDGCDCRDHSRVGMSENDPQPDPANRKAHVAPRKSCKISEGFSPILNFAFFAKFRVGIFAW